MWLAVFMLFAKLALPQTFTEVSQVSGIDHLCFSPTLIGGGCAFFDYDNDGHLDIYVTGGILRDKLYHNQGDGTFVETGIIAGLQKTGNMYTQGVVTGDINNNGYRDIFVTVWGFNHNFFIQPSSNLLFRNNGNGTFTDISASAGINDSAWSVSAAFGDYNLDGWLDIYVGNYVDSSGFINDSTGETIGFSHKGSRNYLYINNGDGTFSEQSASLGVDQDGTALAVAFTDYDQDGDMDIFIANDFGEWVHPNVMLQNNYPLNSFTDVSQAANIDAAIYGMGIAIGDYDEDLDFDYYVTNLGRNVLHNNNGSGVFTDMTDSAGVTNTTVDSLLTTGWGAAFLDYDNDTYLDLFVANGAIPAADFIKTNERDPNKLYKNNMDGTFTDVSVLEGVSDSSVARGFAFGDYDNDGDNDLLIVVTRRDTNNNDHVLLFRNDLSNGNHWLKVKVQGVKANRDGFGSLVRVVSHGRSWIREIDGGSSHASQHSSIAHFGLGSYTTVDSVIVSWPGGGDQVITNLMADQQIHVIQDTGFIVVQTEAALCPGDSIFLAGAYRDTSGIFYDTISFIFGSDSIVITDLIVVPPSVSNRLIELCSGDSLIAGGAYQTLAGNYYDTLTGQSGCDSIVVTQLVILPAYTHNDSTSICGGDSIWLGGAFQNVSGIYNDTLTAINGCDSVIITDLTVFAISFHQTLETICDNQTYYAGGDYQNSSGTYYDTLLSAAGCDSIIETVLTVLPTFFNPVQISICDGDSFYAGSAYQTSSGIYYDTLVSHTGCDSLAEIYLSVHPHQLTSLYTVICEGDSMYLGGAYQKTSGIYFDTLITATGCDSIRITELNLVNLTIRVEPDSATILPGEAVNLIVNSSSTVSLYSWWPGTGLNCDSCAQVVASPEISTEYLVIAAGDNGCLDTSGALIVVLDTTSSIRDFYFSSFRTYPNPTNSLFTIDYSLPQRLDLSLIIYSMAGKEIERLVNEIQEAGDYSVTWNSGKVQPGIYFLKISQGSKSGIIKFVVK